MEVGKELGRLNLQQPPKRVTCEQGQSKQIMELILDGQLRSGMCVWGGVIREQGHVVGQQEKIQHGLMEAPA